MSCPLRAVPRAAVVLAAALALTSSPVSAHRRDFAFTYDWWTPSKGEKEIELTHTYDTRSKNLDGSLEFETGVTERLSASIYYLYAKDRGEALKGEGYALETRYRFGQFAPDKVLPAGYVEYEKEKGESGEVEARLILSHYGSGRSASNFSVNLVGERSTESGSDPEYGYTAGYAVQGGQRLRYGLEATGSLEENAHALGPVLAYDVNQGVRAILSANIALTNRADTRIRLLVEYEWF